MNFKYTYFVVRDVQHKIKTKQNTVFFPMGTLIPFGITNINKTMENK